LGRSRRNARDIQPLAAMLEKIFKP